MRRALILHLLLLAGLGWTSSASAHECSTWLGSCAFSEVIAIGGAAPTRAHAPGDVAVAPDGRLAIADTGAHRALVLDGSGAPQFVAEAGRDAINTVAFGPDGDLWAAAPGHIRRYSRDGGLKTDLTEGLLRGAAGNQSYVAPRGIALDADGRLYAMADGVLLVYGPDGGLEREVAHASERGFWWLIDSVGPGRVVVGNTDAGTIQELDASGHVIGSVTDVPPGFWAPAGDVDDQGRLHLRGSSEIWTYDRTLTRTGSVAHGLTLRDGATAATRDGFLFTDAEGDRLLRVDRAGTHLPALAADPGIGLNQPESVEVGGDGAVLVADTDNRRVVLFGPDGRFDRVLREAAEEPIAVGLGPGRDVYVTYAGGLVERLASDGAVRASWRVADGAFPRGMAVAPDGSVWIRNRGTLQRFSPDGALLSSLEAGLPSTYGSGNGLAVDEAGNLYAALPHAIRKLSPTGQVLAELEAHLAEGVDVLPGGLIAVAAQREVKLMHADGKLIASWGDHGTPVGDIHLPFDIAVDDAGRVYVADLQGQKVVRFTFKAPSAATSGPPPPLPPRLDLRVPRSGVAVSRRGVAALAVTCQAGGVRCRGLVRISRGSRGATAARAALLGTARFDIAPGRARAVRVRLRPAARRALRATTRLRTRATLTVRGGQTVSRAVVLRRRG